MRRTEKWRREWLLFQAALLSGRSRFTAGRYTTLAATTSFVFACAVTKQATDQPLPIEMTAGPRACLAFGLDT